MKTSSPHDLAARQTGSDTEDPPNTLEELRTWVAKRARWMRDWQLADNPKPLPAEFQQAIMRMFPRRFQHVGKDNPAELRDRASGLIWLFYERSIALADAHLDRLGIADAPVWTLGNPDTNRNALKDVMAHFTALASFLARRAGPSTGSATADKAGGPSAAADPTTSTKPPSPPYLFQRVGDVWSLRFGKESTQITGKLSGLGIIARLLAKKHVAISALQLEGHSETQIPQAQKDNVILDRKAMMDCKRRLDEIGEAMKEVAEFQDQSEYRKLESEKAGILDQLRSAKGLGGKQRLLATGNEARKAAERVRKAIAKVCERLREPGHRMHAMADHFTKYVTRDGQAFAYRPVAPEPDWALGG